MIPLLLALIHVVSLPPTRPLSQHHLPLFLPFLLFIIFPIDFISTPISQSVPPLQPKLPLFHHIVPPEDILWLPFDSITTSLDSLLSHWPANSVRHYIFETDFRHYHLSTFLSPSPPPQYTTLSHLSYHPQLLKNITVDLPLFETLPVALPVALPMELPMALPTALPMALPTELPMALPTALSIVSRLILTHGITLGTTLGTTLDTTLGTTLGITNGTTHVTTNRFSSCTLSPYPDTSLPFHFYCITGNYCTYHPLLYHTHSVWIKIIPSTS